MDDVLSSVDRAAVAELAYLAHPYPGIEPVTPLVLGSRACVAFTYDRLALSQALARSPLVALVLSDSRFALKGWSPLVVRARPDVFPDPDGDLFLDRLLDQEVRKFPPARALIDSPLLRRDHPWYLPRLIVRLNDPEPAVPVGRRRGPDVGVLAWVDEEMLGADTVRAIVARSGRVHLSSLARREDAWPRSAPATLLFHDFSVPDMERRTAYRIRGRLEGEVLEVDDVSGARMLPRPMSLLARLRGLRALERACKEGIAAARRA